MKQKIVILKGISGCGKTTWAKKLVAGELSEVYPGKWKRVNKDDLRAMLDNSKWSKENEAIVLSVRDEIIRTSLVEGFNVVVDDTNLAPAHEETIRNIAQMYHGKDPVEVEVKSFLDVPVEECIRRDALRGDKSVGAAVITRMAKQAGLYPKKNLEDVVYKLPKMEQGKQPAIICDIDGTLAHMVDRSPYDFNRVGEDIVDEIVRGILELYDDVNTKILLVSGRDNNCRFETTKWLVDHDVPYNNLYMRDEDDQRPDQIVKREIYEQHIAPHYNVLFVLDDRQKVVDMWRQIGLKCLQVQAGDF